MTAYLAVKQHFSRMAHTSSVEKRKKLSTIVFKDLTHTWNLKQISTSPQNQQAQAFFHTRQKVLLTLKNGLVGQQTFQPSKHKSYLRYWQVTQSEFNEFSILLRYNERD